MLFPDELRDELPEIGSSPETRLEETLVHLKFHDPQNRWKWYAIESDGEGKFFGLIVNPVAAVAGQFTLAELENLRFDKEQIEDQGVIRRDSDFKPMTVGDLAEIETGIKDLFAEQTPLTEILPQ